MIQFADSLVAREGGLATRALGSRPDTPVRDGTRERRANRINLVRKNLPLSFDTAFYLGAASGTCLCTKYIRANVTSVIAITT